MANYFLRHGDYPVYAAVPSGASWPLDAQDGDGLSTGIAVSAVATIALAGVTAAATNTIAVMGAVLTCVASGAGVNQFNAATGAALATNLAAAINAATATVNAGTSAATPQLRDMLYARVDPGLSTSVQIMTRPGSAALNHAANSNVAIAASGFSPAITQFSGGASGAWGYLWNSATTMFPSAKALRTYGVVFLAAAGRPLVGPALTIDDWVYVRGNDAVLTTGTGTAALGVAVTAALNFLVDDGTHWPGSTGTLTIKAELGSGSGGFSLTADNASTLTWGSVAEEKLVFLQAGQSNNSGVLAVAAAATAGRSLTLVNALFDENTTSTTARFGVGLGSNGAFRMHGGRMKFRRNYFYQIISTLNTGAECKVEFESVKFEWTALAIAPGALVGLGASSAIQTWRMVNCEAIGASPQVFSGSSPGLWYRISAFAKNMKGFDLSATLLGQLASSTSQAEDSSVSLLQNIGSDRAMRLETIMMVLDWLPTGGYPTLNSTLPSGTPWSYRLLLPAAGNAFRVGTMTELLSLTKLYEAAPAVATVRLELLVPNDYASTITDGCLGVLISYTDSLGVTRNERASWPLLPRSSTTPLAASSASWTLNSYPLSTAKKIEFTTAAAVKQNTEIEVSLYQRAPMPAQVAVFVDPDLVIVS